VIIDDNRTRAQELREEGFSVVLGNAASTHVLELANVTAARWLMIAIPNSLEAGQIAIHGRQANADLDIIARAHFDDEVDYLQTHEADLVVMGEREIARVMFERLGLQAPAPVTPLTIVPHGMAS
jgi:CPA2 family monovalent cation:H+ antiporter-2